MSITTEQVLEALSIMYNNNNSITQKQRSEAHIWLQSFQKTMYAWQISDVVIRKPDAPIEAKIFAAQTFRQKIEFDLRQLDAQSVASLRDSIMALLYDNRKGPKPIKTQLCIAIADLALQMDDWNDPIQDVMNSFANSPECAVILLTFLNVFPDEVQNNRRVTGGEEKPGSLQRAQQMLKGSVTAILQFLMDRFSNDANDDVRYHVLDCLFAWLRCGEVTQEVIKAFPILDLAFEALAVDELLDMAVDLVCEIVVISAKSQPRDMELVQLICHKLASLVPRLQQSTDESELVRGICRILVEAGEGYIDLIVPNAADFSPVLEGILFCTSFDDLEIVRIPFTFWHMLTDLLVTPEYNSYVPAFAAAYDRLVDIMLKHLRYPESLKNWNASERDEFREFRHVMGDILKDCVKILGEENTLVKPYTILSSVFRSASGSPVSPPNGSPVPVDSSIPWQDIEAPMFALRAMCREVNLQESKFLPEIMRLLPLMPPHPKIKYAAILVIGRYAEWTNAHPEMLSYQLDFVSKAFSDKGETLLAACQSFKDLCKYCSKHLVSYLPQLHPFYIQTLVMVDKNERRQLTEAIAHIVSSVPFSELGTTMRMFCLPLAQKLHQYAELVEYPSDQQFKAMIVDLNELSTFFRFVVPRQEEAIQEPHPCMVMLAEMMPPIIEKLFLRYAKEEPISEALCRLFRNTIETYRLHFLPVLPKLVELLVQTFETTGFPCYLWVAGRCVRTFGQGEEQLAGSMVQTLVEKMTELVFKIAQSAPTMASVVEVMEEYFSMLSDFVYCCPNRFVSSSLPTSTFQCGLFCLQGTDEPALVLAILRFYHDVFVLAQPNQTRVAVVSVQPMSHLLDQHAQDFITALMKGLVFTFPRDREIVDDVSDCLDLVCQSLGLEKLFGTIQRVVESHFPESNEASVALRDGFLRKLGAACEARAVAKVAAALRDYAASYTRRNLIESRNQTDEA